MGPRFIWLWLSSQTLRGLLLMVPLIITIECIVWMSRTIENQLQPVATLLLPPEWYGYQASGLRRRISELHSSPSLEAHRSQPVRRNSLACSVWQRPRAVAAPRC